MIYSISDEYIKARNNVRGITIHDDSNYETEKELGRGRRKKTNKLLSSDSDSEEERVVKKSSKTVAAPPKIQPPFHCDFYESVPSCSYNKENTTKKKKFNIKVNLHKSQKIQKQQVPLNRSDVKGKAQLVQNVLDARKRTAEKFQKTLSSQSFSSNSVIKAKNSLPIQSQEHQIELVHTHTDKSKYNTQILSEKNDNKLQQSAKIPQPLPNVEKNLDFESSMEFNNTEDSVANYVSVKKPIFMPKPNIHADIPSETSPNFEYMELPQFCSTNIGESQKSSFTSSERDNKMQGIYLILSCHLLRHKLEII